MAERFSIAQVTPYGWEAGHEVNLFVERTAGELVRRGHRVVVLAPSDYVPWLTDRKWAHIRVEGEAFGEVPLNLEMKLEVWDSPNSAGIVIDAVRCCKLALNHGVAGQLDGPSSYFMKSPHTQRPDGDARDETERFIAEYARRPGTRATGTKAPATSS